jgi:hypothetical protein
MIKAPMHPWLLMDEIGLSPDAILIDGRFRVASFIASYFSAKKPATLVFDDYVDRLHYHTVESLIKPIEIIDRAAIFRLNPPVNSLDVGAFLKLYAPLLISAD